MKHHSVHRALSFLAVATLSSAALAQTLVTKTDSTQEYFDNNSGVRSFLVSAADMAGGTVVNSVTIAIDFDKPGYIPWYGEIGFTLTNPDGVTTTLINRGSFGSGAGTGGFRGVITFDDLAADFVNTNSSSVQAGTFKPVGPGTMSSLNSLSGVGTWTLGIRDTGYLDSLGYYSSTLTLNGSAANAALTPEVPAGVQAIPVLLAVGGMALYQRKKKQAAQS